MTHLARFFEATWLRWWLFAVLAISRWCWINFIRDRHGDDDGPKPWRELYRIALLERDATEIAVRIEEAEQAIVLALGTHMLRPHDPEWRALQDAMNNLRALRENANLQIKTTAPRKDRHRSMPSSRPPHSWGSWGSIH